MIKKGLQILVFSLLLFTTFNLNSYNSPLGLNENDIIKSKGFSKLLDFTINYDTISLEGGIGKNKEKYTLISYQRGGLKMIMKGISDSEENYIDLGIKALEYGFKYQNDDGSFKNTLGFKDDNPDIIESNAFFLQSVGHSYLLIKSSQYSDKYLSRLDKLKPKIEKGLELLETQKEILYNKAKKAPNRLLFDALAFKLNGIILENSDFEKLGDRFVNLNLERQKEDGTFLEYGGYDSSYQAVSLLKLQIYLLYSDNVDLNKNITSSLKKGMDWMKTRIEDTGKVSIEGNVRTGSCQETKFGKCKDVNYEEVILSFLYYSSIFNDIKSGKIASKIINYIDTGIIQNLSGEDLLKKN